MTFLFLINPTVALLCFLMALAFLRLKPLNWWTLFTIFMLITTTVEWAGFYIYSHLGQKNHWLYNLYLPVEISFLLFAIFHVCKSLFRSGMWTGLLALLFFVVYMIESFQSGFREYSGNANLVAALGFIVLCLCFYYYLMKQDEYVDLPRYAPFWFISGVFIFYLGTVAVNIFQQQLTQLYTTTGLPVRYIIMLLLNFIMYSSWSYAFICRSRQKILSN